MTDREKAKQLLDELPENRLSYVIGFMLGIIALEGMEKAKEGKK